MKKTITGKSFKLNAQPARRRASHSSAMGAKLVWLALLLAVGGPSAALAADTGAKPLTMVPGRSDGAVQPDGGRYALVIGIDDYSADLNQHGTADLKYSVKDARAVYDALTRFGGFSPSHIRLMLNGQATHDAILTYLASLSDPRVFPGAETFLLYFCGHGMLFDTRSDAPDAPGQRDNVLVPVDGSNLAALAASHNISLMEVLQDLQRAQNFPRQILLLDACRSVETLEGAQGFGPPPGFDFDFAAYKPYAHGRLVLSSSSQGQRSWEDQQLQDGVFSHFVIQALTTTPGADNADGVVTIGALEDYVAASMAEWSRLHTDKIQTPQLWGTGDPAMPLTLLQRARTMSLRQQAQQVRVEALKADGLGKTEDAIRLYAQAAQIDPTWDAPLNDLGIAYYRQKRYAEAGAEYKAALNLAPGDAYVHNNLGALYHDTGSDELAEQELLAAIRYDSQFAMPHNSLGNVYSDRRNYDAAIRQFQAAIQLDRNWPLPHNGLGGVYRKQGKPNAAIPEFQEAIRLDFGWSATPHYGLGLTYADLGRNKEAIAEFKSASSSSPHWASPHNSLGDIYHQQHLDDLATAELKTAIRLDPGRAEPHNTLGNIYSDHQRYSEAIGEFQTAVDLDHNWAFPHNGLGGIYRVQRKFDAAIAEFKEAMRLDPGWAATPHNGLGLVYLDQERFDEALGEFQAALKLAPNYGAAKNNLALAQAGKARARR